MSSASKQQVGPRRSAQQIFCGGIASTAKACSLFCDMESFQTCAFQAASLKWVNQNCAALSRKFAQHKKRLSGFIGLVQPKWFTTIGVPFTGFARWTFYRTLTPARQRGLSIISKTSDFPKSDLALSLDASSTAPSFTSGSSPTAMDAMSLCETSRPSRRRRASLAMTAWPHFASSFQD